MGQAVSPLLATRTLVLAISALTFLAMPALEAAEVIAPSAVSGDAVIHPPLQRLQRSADLHYRLDVSAVDGWRSPVARGQLWLEAANPPRLIWDRSLPQSYGPRRMLVAPGGRVLLLDEGSNVRSRHALVLIDPRGHTVLNCSFDQIQAVVDLPAALLVQRALSGSWWLSGPPLLSPKGEGERVQLPVGGRTLELEMVSGKLRRLP